QGDHGGSPPGRVEGDGAEGVADDVAEQGGLPCCCLGPSAALPLHRRRLQGDDDRTAQRRQLVEAPAQELDGPVRPVAAPLVLPARRRDEGLAQHRVAVDAFPVQLPPHRVAVFPHALPGAPARCGPRASTPRGGRRRAHRTRRPLRPLALPPSPPTTPRPPPPPPPPPSPTPPPPATPPAPA